MRSADTVELHFPMHVAGEVAQLQRGCRVARLQTEPRRLLHPDDHGTMLLQQQHGTVGQVLGARQRDGALGPAVGERPQPVALRIGFASG